MIISYTSIISAVRRLPRMSGLNDTYMLAMLFKVVDDVVIRIPESNVKLPGEPYEIDLNSGAGVQQAYPVGNVSQVFSVALRSANNAYTKLTETNLGSLNNDNPDWATIATGTPKQWYPYFGDDGFTRIGLYPPISTTVAPHPPSGAQFDKLIVHASANPVTVATTDPVAGDSIPISMYPGLVLEEGLAAAIARDVDPVNQGAYQTSYEVQVAMLTDRIVTMYERIKDPSLRNARS